MRVYTAPRQMKPHLVALDGLRGTAAISILIFHFQLPTFDPAHPSSQWLLHAYLAVDFFFCLSGYVIGYAYDDRRGQMRPSQFLTARLIRLHPLVLIGVVLGLLTYVFDPFSTVAWPLSRPETQTAPFWKLATCALAGLLMIPSWGLPNRAGAYFSLNVPCWSLMWEYLANVAYAFALWRMKRPTLLLLVALGAVAILVSAFHGGSLVFGSSWGQMQYALVRTIYSFCVGLLLYRCRVAVSSRFGFVSLSVVMILVFMLPYNGRLNWLYDSIVVLLLFPLMVALGAGAVTSTRVASVCQMLGRLSYPIYILHNGLTWMFADYFLTHGVPAKMLPLFTPLVSGLIVLLSYGVLILYDEPIRRRLSTRRVESQGVLTTHPT
jgi:peptidoglycan/LPS O-acetylase OafA/YrhL